MWEQKEEWTNLISCISVCDLTLRMLLCEIQDIRLVHSSFCSHTLKIYHFDSKIKKFNCLGWIWEKGLLFKNTIFRRNGIFLCQISLFYTITFPILIYRISNDTPTPCSYIFEIFCLIFYFIFSMLFLVASLFFCY